MRNADASKLPLRVTLGFQVKHEHLNKPPETATAVLEYLLSEIGCQLHFAHYYRGFILVDFTIPPGLQLTKEQIPEAITEHGTFRLLDSAEYGKLVEDLVTLKPLEEQLNKLTDEQRQELFSNYCSHCGCTDPGCQCWNDE